MLIEQYTRTVSALTPAKIVLIGLCVAFTVYMALELLYGAADFELGDSGVVEISGWRGVDAAPEG